MGTNYMAIKNKEYFNKLYEILYLVNNSIYSETNWQLHASANLVYNCHYKELILQDIINNNYENILVKSDLYKEDFEYFKSEINRFKNIKESIFYIRDCFHEGRIIANFKTKNYRNCFIDLLKYYDICNPSYIVGISLLKAILLDSIGNHKEKKRETEKIFKYFNTKILNSNLPYSEYVLLFDYIEFLFKTKENNFYWDLYEKAISLYHNNEEELLKIKLLKLNKNNNLTQFKDDILKSHYCSYNGNHSKYKNAEIELIVKKSNEIINFLKGYTSSGKF